jgi:hypothetical protein
VENANLLWEAGAEYPKRFVSRLDQVLLFGGQQLARLSAGRHPLRAVKLISCWSLCSIWIIPNEN